ncbi:epiplakin [Dromiciops gliroides]|uniref:epiplakin n=1 Tax=Dromiciops gliroides TaxID=33562 RepID=UPI001CC5911D|nr:epiplakin [Dromiciops gliroides]
MDVGRVSADTSTMNGDSAISANGIGSLQTHRALKAMHKAAPPEPRMEYPVTSHDGETYPQQRGPIAGVYLEASAQPLSLYEAMQQGLLPAKLGLALLEAQAATGGLIDPTQGQLLPVAEAVRQGLVGLELKEKLLTAERALTGYSDPYGPGKLPLFQALHKEVVARTSGLSWLEAQLATGGIIDPAQGGRVPLEIAYQRGLLDEETGRSLADPTADGPQAFSDPNTQEPVTYQELRDRCVLSPATGLALLPVKITFPALGGMVSSEQLLEAGVLSREVFEDLKEGRLLVPEVRAREEVQRYLEGTGGVAGVLLLSTGQRRSIYQALMEHLLPPGTALALLQAQAATGSLMDPASDKKLGLDEAVRTGLVGPEFREKLLVAERAVTGYPDPFSMALIPLFQAMRKGLVQKELAFRLLEAQLATGGIIDPVRKHRLPLKTALQWDYLDKETIASLSQPTGFFDPNTEENLTYEQLLVRCVTDPETGSLLLPISGGDGRGYSEGRWFIDHATQEGLRKATVVATSGKLKGQMVSVWKLLFSDAIPAEQRADLAHQYREGALSVEILAAQLRATIDQAAAASQVTFKGLRDHVTPRELLKSEIINQDLYEKLEQGQTTAQDVGGLDSVRKYLQGTGCISGLLLPDSQEKISIYEARRKGYLRPGTSLILLEAQAATGFIIDPKENKRYSVEDALRANVIGPDIYEKLLSAERAVTGYVDPYTGDRLSLFQAMNKDLIVRDHGIRLLEAQIATGGIIDPVHSHRVPVEVAYKRGYFDRTMNLVLSDPSDDTRGFFDPNTHENLTYLQLLEKCVTEPATGLCLLPLNSQKPQLVNEATRQAFQSYLLLVKYGRFKGQRVSVWDLINSEYFKEGQRREILTHYRLKKISLEQIVQRLEEEMKKWAGITLPTLRGCVTAYQLLESHIIDRDLLEKVLEGRVSPEELLRVESVRRYLHGSGTIGGVLLQPSNQRLSLYEAMKQKLLGPGVALPLLEAQAATGSLVDPVSREKLSVDDAVRKGLVGPELHEKLRHAEEAVTGFTDPFTGKKVSLFQAMKKGLVSSQQAVQLLEAQVATGGIIDPKGHHHVPMEVATQRGYIDEEMERTLSGASPATIQTFSTVDGSETLSYAQLIEHCQQDEASGYCLLPLPQTGPPVSSDEQIQQVFQATLVTEKNISLWDLLCSGYFTEDQRAVFLEDFRLGRMTAQEIIAAALRQVREAELQAQTRIMLPGLRGDVPAVWMLDTGIIDLETLEGLVQGTQSPSEVAQRPEVKRYLQGTGCIAGVQVEGSKAKMSIYQAMKSNLLPPGLGLRLLEAQLAAGSLVDPQNSQKLSVEDAVKTGVIGVELSEQLIQAERAATGYADPYTGNTISVWQAMGKGLIDQSEGFLLLQVQLATGGIVDPLHHLHLPLPAACRLGFLDEETNQVLAKTTEDKKFFFDPNTHDKVTYQELKDRCILDSETGLWLLPLSRSVALDVDDHTIMALKAMTVPVKVGRFKGQTVSLWDLLHSEYVSADKQKELVDLGRSGRAAALRQVVTDVTALIEETEQRARQITFPGLRKQVSANDLFRSQLIDKKTLDDLNQGKKTVHEVTEMEGVKQFLEGGNFIAGVLIQSTKERLSIYDAMRRHILRPGTALVLLEAQAATGFIIDPVQNKKLSVEQALSAGLIGREVYEKLLSAEKAVTGYVEPYTNEQISLFEAMNKGLILKSHAIRLLEAQIATGGIIDPIHSHRVPVEVAYQRGYFDEEMNQILSDPSDDTKGFFDPNTHENLTYLQLLERCIQESETGLYMLQIVQKGENYIYIDEATKQLLRSRTTKVPMGKFAHQTVSVWDLLSSQYFTQQKKRDLVRQFKSKTLHLEQLLEMIMNTMEETEKRNQAIKVKGIRTDVTAAELFNSGIIDEKILAGLPKGKKAAERLSQLEAVKRYTEGTGCIAGVLMPSTEERMSVYEAMKTEVIPRPIGMQLLQAQAATGFIINPVHNQKLSVDEAVAAGVVGEEVKEDLQNAEKAVTGYEDPDTGERISLYKAMKKGLVEKEEAMRMLEAQVATGGVIDPRHGHRVPVDVAYQRGCLDPEMYNLLSNRSHGSKRYQDPNTHEKVNYAELHARCVKDQKTGLGLVPLVKQEKNYRNIEEVTEKALKAEMVVVEKGKYKGRKMSVWDLLCSEYVTEDKKQELVQKYRQDTSRALENIVKIIWKLIEEKEKKRTEVWFKGLRRQVTATELFKANIINKDVLDELERGQKEVTEIAEKERVKKYLEGTSSIAGVLVPSKADPAKQEKMSIYQAMWKGILRPGTALVLLEAQAATGFVIDPLRNQKLSVEEAVAAGVVGGEIQGKLLSAEKAVTGYTDPYTGEQISLFQAMKRDLIVKDHGVRLLEAQIATGGVIDPVHSHRVPVEVAYQRGYFDEEMSQILSDPSDDTKGFFDPNTHENLTYMQLLRRCVRDPDTGLYMLQLVDKNSAVSQLNEQMRRVLQDAMVTVHGGLFRGQTVSVWELLWCRDVPESQRQALLRKYREGTLSIEELSSTLATLVMEAGDQSPRRLGGESSGDQRDASARSPAGHSSSREGLRPRSRLQAATMEVKVGHLRGQKVPVWDVLVSTYVTEVTREDLLAQYDSGALPLPALTRRLTTIIEESEGVSQDREARQSEGGHSSSHSSRGGIVWQEGPAGADADAENSRLREEALGALRTTTMEVKVGQFKGQMVPVWDVLFSKYLTEARREELLAQHASGALTLQALITTLTTIIEETEEKLSKVSFRGLRRQVSASELRTSNILGLDTLRDLAQGTKSLQEITEMDSVKRYLEGTSCIAGVLVPSKADPAKQEKMSIYQAMWKGILRPGTALVLLEAQAATGFVIDPLRNQKLSVEEAVAAGVVGGEIQEKLLSAEKAVTGYTDPYTGEQISLFQAMKRDLIVKDHGVRLLEAQIATGGVIDPVHSHRVPVEVAYQRGYFDEEMSQILSDPSDDTKGFFDPNTHENLTYMQLLRRCVRDPDTGLYMLQLVDKNSAVSQLNEQMRRVLQDAMVTVHGGLFRGQTVSVWELLWCRDVPESQRQALLRKYREGTLSIEELSSTLATLVMEAGDQSPRRLGGESSGDQRDASARSPAGHSSSREGLHPRSRLQAATMEVKVGHLRGQKVPVWDVLVSTYVTEVTREDLLAQYDSGALPLPALTRRLTTIIEESEGVSQDREARQSEGGHSSSHSSSHSSRGGIVWQEGLAGADADAENSRLREEALGALRTTTMEVKVGQFKGQMVPVWDVLFSKYLTEARREELLAQHASGALTLQALITTLTTIIEETEEKLSKVSFRGLRRQVSASELRTSNILGLDTLRDLAQGTKSLQEITEMDSVKRYLEGTSCIAGVLVPSKADPAKQEKMSIYQAMWKGILRPGTALVLLEAQAATGFVIDPLRNQKLSVEEAVAAGVVGGEIQGKLLSAEKAVTGYTDPYTGEQISLFQAMKRDLIVKDHGVRLLEAQIATGGVIDPVHSHRVPVEVAYQRGYFDEEMSQILSDPSDDTKGFFDPNTHENLTYMQLLRRCVRDPDTGLYMLQLVDKNSAVSQLNEQMRRVLQDAMVTVHGGLFRGQTVSVWELLWCRDVPESQRQALLRKYREGTLSIEELSSTLATLVMEAGDQSPRRLGGESSGDQRDASARSPAGHSSSREGLRPRSRLQAATMEVKVGHLRGQKVPVWDVLVSTYVTEVTREDLLAQYDSGALPLPALTRRLTTIIEESEGVSQDREARQSEGGHSSSHSSSHSSRGGIVWQEGLAGADADAENSRLREEALGALRTTTMEVKVGQFKGQMVPVWDVLFSKYLTEARREELLAQHASGALTLQALITTLTTIIEETEEKLSKVSFRGLRRQVSASELRTSNILGLDTLRDLAQGTKSLQEITEMDSVKRYLEGTSCIAGVLVPSKADPAKQEKMSIYQAMWKGILRPGTALVLLEAQAATGFVIDPLRNQKLSVEEAVAAGVVGGEIQGKLLSAEKAVTGYTDPYTGEQISLFQAMKRDLIVKDHGVRLLEAQIATGGVIDPVHSHRVPVEVAYQRGYFDEEMSQILSDPSDDTKGFFDPNTHENLTYMQLLRRCVRDPDTGLYMLQLVDKNSAVSQLNEQMRRVLQDAMVTVHGGLFRGQTVSVWELLWCRDVPESQRQALLRKYREGTLSIEELSSTLATLVMEAGDQSPRRLGGESSGDQRDASARSPAGHSSSREGLRPRSRLQAATMEVKVGHLRGQKVPVWDVLVSTYVTEVTREDLLAQYDSGALPLPALTRRLTTIIEESEGVSQDREARQSEGGHSSSHSSRGGIVWQEGPAGADADAENSRLREEALGALRTTTMEVKVGQFKGQMVPVWDVLFSKYLTEARREELLAQHASGALTLQALITTLTTIIEETEEKLSKVSFRGLRRQVSASELRTSNILGLDTLRDLAQGTKSLQEITEMDSVKRYLEGTSCIAGVLVPSKADPAKQEKMSIYQAMWKGILRPGTALVLLEAQAATGFVIDPLRNQKLSVEEAVAAGVVGGEIQGKLLSAEKAVTGYTDPYTGEQISLFQAMKRDLIVKDHGVRLLEAQIATGGVIDPVHSHRVPVEVAYQRGYFDEEMSQILSDPSDDTKGFFDPNTHENLTYMQLLRRCVRDPDTGLYMLQLVDKNSAVSQLNEQMRRVLQDAMVTVHGGLFRGQTVSVWELLWCRDVPESQRQALLRKYREGTLSIEELSSTLATLVMEAGDQSPRRLGGESSGDQRDASARSPAGHSSSREGLRPRSRLQAATMEVKVGHLRGQKVPVWDVLVSTYVTEVTREDLLAQYDSGALPLPALTRRLTTIIEESEGVSQDREARQSEGGHSSSHSSSHSSRGGIVWQEGLAGADADAENSRLREEALGALRTTTMEVKVGQFKGQMVPVWDVLFSKYLTEARREELLAQHASGALTLQALITTLTTIIEETEEKLSKVSFRGLRRQVSASELRTSNILGLDTLRDLAQGTKSLQEITEMDSVKRYLEGTSCIAGVLVPSKADPAKQEKMSIYQAMWKGILRPGTALVLLEAQAATGFVIDPLRNQKLSVEEAVAAGVVGGEIQGKLLSAEKAVTGYTDPYTGEQISLFQAMKRDLIVKDHGVRLLEAQIATGGVIDPVHSHRVPVEVAYQRGYFDEEMSQILSDPSDDTKGFFDPNTHENLTYMQLLRRCVRDPDTGLYMLQLVDKNSAVSQLNEQMRRVLQDAMVTVHGGLFRGQTVSVWELLWCRDVPESQRQALLRKYREGTLSIEELSSTLATLVMEAGDQSPRRLGGESSGDQRDASARSPAGHSSSREGLRPRSRLQAATMEVKVGHLRGQKVPVWDVLVSTYVTEVTREDLLAQYDSGALPLPALTRRLTTIIEESEGVSQDREARQSEGGHSSSHSSRGGIVWQEGPAGADADAENSRLREEALGALRTTTMEVKVGQFKGQMVPVWDVLFSKYLTEARREELLAQHASGALTLQALITTLTTIIEETEEKLSKVSFRGLRRQVSASELRTSNILGLDTLRDLAQGTKSLQEITEMDSVKRYLEGTSCIAGVLVPSKADPAKQEKMSIYQAMWKGILRPGTALVLLEAQAATGFVIDPLRNQKLSVEEAVAAGVVGGEIQGKLLSAEKAVTGYTDPYTGEQISLFQAMKRDLIVKDHGVRLLEAQIATGGVIDPVHSHRVPVEVAYQRGYFDEEMSQILSDPSDDTKGFFDPNTHENLTYMQLLRRCVRDPDTGLYMLQLVDKNSAVSQLNEQMRRVLQDAMVTVHGGLFRGQTVSVWELLWCRDVPESQRQALLRKYREGTLSIEELSSTLATLVMEAGDQSPRRLGGESSGDQRDASARSPAGHSSSREGLRPRSRLQAATMEVKVGHLRGQKVPVWDVLVSTYVTEVTREDLLAQYDSGALPLPALTRRLTTIIEESEGVSQDREARQSEGGHSSSHSSSHSSRGGIVWQEGPAGADADAENSRLREEALGALRTTTMEVKVGQFKGQMVPVWDVLFSKYLTEARREELLAQHASGALTLQALITTLTTIIEETEEKLSKVSFRGLRRQVSASELRTSNILGLDTLRDLAQGTKSLQEITEMDSVKRYLEGTSCIAGVLVPSKADPAKQEKMSIYQAMWKGILRPGTALVLLEAQAATGFVIDPLRNQKLSVEEAVAAGVVGGEIQEKLLSAEKAVTGYTDPYTGEQISLFQAMKRDLIVKDHGVRLLEAQIATGGVIDPVHSHRVPVEVAYQRGYFDEEMSQILSDPSDDTKGFFDPNTHENLTYMELLQRCTLDPASGLLFLSLK